MRFPPWSLPRVGNGGGKSHLLLLVFLLRLVVTWLKGSGSPRRHLQMLLLMSFRTEASNAEEMEKIAPPLPPKERGVRWANLAIFFLALGLGEVCTGTPGTCLQREQA